jgi:uncharacterized protein (TIGR00296 family)
LKVEDEVGRVLVKETRKLIEEYLSNGALVKPSGNLPLAHEKRGAFVTLNSIRLGEPSLRGCMGIAEPIYPLWDAISIAALTACRDPRFPPMEPDEMDTTLVELSILTPPTPLTGNPRRFPELVKVGRDGLIIQWRGRQGLLLPQVAVEQGWTAEDFLVNTCFKAGLPPDAWLTGAKVSTFQADVFSEVSPRGPVKRVL